jgi:hemolysin III
MTNGKAPKRAQTKGEEIFNAVTHSVGGAIGIAVLVLGIIFSAGNGFALFGMILYGICMIILYTASSLYHFLPAGAGKRVFRIFDHCTIFLLIAGTYSPVCLVALRDTGWGWPIFGFVWAATILGIVGNSINMHNKFIKISSQIMYILMGWCVVVAFVPLLRVFAGNLTCLWLMIAGGIAYTAGTLLFYRLSHKVKYFHGIWHLCVLAGTVLHFCAILFYVIL